MGVEEMWAGVRFEDVYDLSLSLSLSLSPHLFGECSAI